MESGLRLYEEEGIKGIEFPVGGRFIDILAVDSSNNLVVIELKVSRGYDRVVGQLMRYVAWVKQNLAEDAQKVRGMIVARQISQDLILACSLVAGCGAIRVRTVADTETGRSYQSSLPSIGFLFGSPEQTHSPSSSSSVSSMAEAFGSSSRARSAAS